MNKSFNKKCKPGVGLRPTHFPYLETNPKLKVDWFEAVSENYMDSFGRPRIMLQKLREDYPIALHGVSMNLLNPDGLDDNYLKNLKALVDEIDPFVVSDHLCWTGIRPSNIHDLLPFPFTKEALETVVNNIDHAQNVLGRTMLIENVSTYMSFGQSEIPEWDFLNEAVKRTDANILLDVNNIYVSAINHKYDPYKYLDAIPPNLVKQIHFAGYSDMGDFLFDTHSKPVYPEVWDLFIRFIKKAPETPFMMEWDEDIPEFSVVEDEVLKAVAIWNRIHGKNEVNDE